MAKKVSVIILNYKVKDQVLECIQSIVKSNYTPLEIIVVDNNSQDGIADIIKKYPGIKFIQTGDNLGYTGGNNIGIKKALDLGAEYILVLNPDTTIDKNAINYLVGSVENLDAGIVGPKIFFEGAKKIWYAGGIFDGDNILGIHRGVDEIDTGQYDHQENTEFVSGAAIFIKKEVFTKIGFFDEKYFLYLEDLEFCYRAKINGVKIVYNPKALVYHENAKSTGLGSSLQDYFIVRNRLLFAFKYLSFRKRLALLKHIVLTLKFPTRRLALWDFLIGNFGKGSFIK